MEYKVSVGISNRHVHLTKETYQQLFDEPLEIVKELNQVGEFASNQFVSLKSPNGTIEKVRIVGPFRNYNQVEILKSDAYQLKLNPPVRKSGDLKNAETITIVGPKKEITLENVCIIAQRHVHLNVFDLEKFNVKDNDLVKIKVEGDRSAILDAYIKASANGVFELHIDRDEANALLLQENEKVTLMIGKN
jgi:putative phosphotransacetylase